MITLKKRARRITRFFDELDHDDEFPKKVYSAVLKSFQHVRRGTIDQALSILKQDITRDEAIRRINVL
jgi:hypothetical protein